MAWTDALLRLQEIDLELDGIQQRLSAIAAQLQDHTALLASQKQAQQSAAATQKARKAQQDLEFELGRVETKLRQTEHRLYSGEVRNPRELTDLQNEAVSLRRRQSQLEDALLEAMAAREEREAAEAQAAATLLAAEQTTATTEAALTAEREQLQARAATLQAERERPLGHIAPAVLESYTYLRQKRGGKVIARLAEGTCTACGMEVSAPTRRQIQSGQVPECDGCGRLLVP